MQNTEADNHINKSRFRYFDKVNNQYQTLKRVERVKDQLTKLRQRNEVGIQYAKLSIVQQNHNLLIKTL